MPPPFFFSYAHNDALDDKLLKFFTEVNKRVRMISGAKEDGFLDTARLKAGEEWSAQVVDALRTSPAMVSLYSPSYFQSTVCGQELQIFLERRHNYRLTHAGKRPGNIIPVLWQPEKIPLTLPDFQHERPRSRDMASEGVWFVGDRGDRRQFTDIAYSVAKRVKEARDTPLPDLTYQPVLNGVASAFEPEALPPPEFDTPDATAGPDSATFVHAGASGWRSLPFAPPDQQSLLYIAASVAKGRDLRPYTLTIDPASIDLTRLHAARERNNLLIFLVDGRSLGDTGLAAQLRAFDEAPVEGCSTVVVWPPGTANAAAIPGVFRRLSERQPPFFHASIDNPDRLAEAIGDSLDALQTSLLKAPRTVTPLVGPSLYQSIPSISGTPSRAA
jgi:hypothetical protein